MKQAIPLAAIILSLLCGCNHLSLSEEDERGIKEILEAYGGQYRTAVGIEARMASA